MREPSSPKGEGRPAVKKNFESDDSLFQHCLALYIPCSIEPIMLTDSFLHCPLCRLYAFLHFFDRRQKLLLSLATPAFACWMAKLFPKLLESHVFLSWCRTPTINRKLCCIHSISRTQLLSTTWTKSADAQHKAIIILSSKSVFLVTHYKLVATSIA